MTFPIISIGFVGKKDLGIPVIFEFVDIMNTPVLDPTDISDWTSFWGALFTSVEVVGNKCFFYGGTPASPYPDVFYDTPAYRGMLKSIIDEYGVFATCNNGLRDQSSLLSVKLNGLIYIPANCCVGSSIEYFEANSATIVNPLAFDATPLEIFVAPNIETINAGAFRNTNLTGVYEWDHLTSCIGNGIFENSKIEEFIAPNLIGTLGNNMFRGCSLLKKAVCPLITRIGTNVNSAAFQNTPLLEEAIYPNATYVGANSFWTNASLLTSIDLRSATFIGGSAFRQQSGVITYRLDSCINLGSTTGNDSVFLGNTGNTITCYLPLATQTDGDAAYLASNNTVTFIP